jgi:hypothetical protein
VRELNVECPCGEAEDSDDGVSQTPQCLIVALCAFEDFRFME